MSTDRILRTLAFEKFAVFAILVGAATLCVALPANGHEVWIETATSAKRGESHEIHVCWGHSGQKETGPAMAAQQNKLTACVLGPGGREPLTLAKGSDSFTANFTPKSPGGYVVGADLQVGIIDREFHGMPPKTRIVMYGKSVAHATGQGEATVPLGVDLEIVPVSPVRDLKPGDLVTVKILHKGRPIGGRDVLVSAKTSGTLPPPEDPKVQTSEWSTQAMAHPVSGEVTVPLIVGGQHLFHVKYFDETPGT